MYMVWKKNRCDTKQASHPSLVSVEHISNLIGQCERPLPPSHKTGNLRLFLFQPHVCILLAI